MSNSQGSQGNTAGTTALIRLRGKGYSYTCSLVPSGPRAQTWRSAIPILRVHFGSAVARTSFCDEWHNRHQGWEWAIADNDDLIDYFNAYVGRRMEMYLILRDLHMCPTGVDLNALMQEAASNR